MSEHDPQALAPTPEHELRACDPAPRLFDVENPPRLVGAEIMAQVFNIGLSAFYKNAKRGLYDVFKVKPALGPQCYSGILLARWLKGESLYLPTFGAKRKRA